MGYDGDRLPPGACNAKPDPALRALRFGKRAQRQLAERTPDTAKKQNHRRPLSQQLIQRLRATVAIGQPESGGTLANAHRSGLDTSMVQVVHCHAFDRAGRRRLLLQPVDTLLVELGLKVHGGWRLVWS